MNFKEALEAAIEECDGSLATPRLIGELELELTEIEDEIVETSRWGIVHEAVYQEGDRFWRVTYVEPATEYQDWDSSETVIYEVEPYTHTVTSYRPVG